MFSRYKYFKRTTGVIDNHLNSTDPNSKALTIKSATILPSSLSLYDKKLNSFIYGIKIFKSKDNPLFSIAYVLSNNSNYIHFHTLYHFLEPVVQDKRNLNPHIIKLDNQLFLKNPISPFYKYNNFNKYAALSGDSNSFSSFNVYGIATDLNLIFLQNNLPFKFQYLSPYKIYNNIKRGTYLNFTGNTFPDLVLTNTNTNVSICFDVKIKSNILTISFDKTILCCFLDKRAVDIYFEHSINEVKSFIENETNPIVSLKLQQYLKFLHLLRSKSYNLNSFQSFREYITSTFFFNDFQIGPKVVFIDLSQNHFYKDLSKLLKAPTNFQFDPTNPEELDYVKKIIENSIIKHKISKLFSYPSTYPRSLFYDVFNFFYKIIN